MRSVGMADDEKEQDARRALDVVQSMIDISADRLDGLRTQCATSAELTQQEIRSLEGKLIKLYSRMLQTKSNFIASGLLQVSEVKNVPPLKQWLQVVGLSSDAIYGVLCHVTTLECLKDTSDKELQRILVEREAKEEDVRRLNKSLHNLKRYLQDLNEKGDAADDSDLFWDSWERQHAWRSAPLSSTSPRIPRTRAARCSVPSEDFVPYNNNIYSHNSSSLSGSMASSTSSSINSLPYLGGTPTHHAPLSPPLQSMLSSYTPPSTPPITKGKEKGRFPTTPPSRRKLQTVIQSSPQTHHTHLHHAYDSRQDHLDEAQNTPTHHSAEQNQSHSSQHYSHHGQPQVPQHLAQQVHTVLGDGHILTKSKSHESQLGNRVEGADSNNGNEGSEGRPRRGRLPTEPGPNSSTDYGQTSPLLSSPIKSPPCSTDSDDSSMRSASLQVPRSPRTTTVSRCMGHVIQHRFTSKFLKLTTCDYCDKQMFMGMGLKCKECKYKCHRDCESKVPPSCGLPRELVDEFKKTLISDGIISNQSPSLGRPSPSHHPNNRFARKPPAQIPPFHGPDSSSNTSSCNSSTPSSPALMLQPHASSAAPSTKQQSFQFPDVSSSRGVTLETHPLTAPPAFEEILDSHKAQKDGYSVDSDKTISASGSGSISTDSERTPVRVDSQDSQVSDGELVDNRGWPRQNSLSMREWDIPFDELKLHEPIGTGHFGTVYRGNWHGDVAVKVLNVAYLDSEKTLDGFKLEVAIFRKTRHENLVLFMGACMKPPRLAIVTSMCKGNTLYTHIHLRKDKFTMHRTTIVAQQISQGMGYLHARGIVHKDLKTKNIFLENGKIVITDFGLFSITKLCFGNSEGRGLSIPPGWLCYLAPEVMCCLNADEKQIDEELPFSKASDVYAFGTIWYELLCGEWPFKGQPPEAIVWQVGKGMKQTLANLQASRDVKDILMSCWSFNPEDRPDFVRLLKTLEKLPKKRLARSPSHPIHLSRSAESVF